MTPRPPLLFYCQHSVGMGHLTRSLALTRALANRFDVTFLSGGAMPKGLPRVDHMEWVQLPAVGLDEHGSLVSRDDGVTLADAFADRARLLLDVYETVRPRVVVVELFPFGRRKFRAELEPMLARARRDDPANALVFCSLRDILVSRGERQREHDTRAADLLDRYFDGVLVHSDPAFARLEESFAPDRATSVPVIYTGFVHDAERVSGERCTRRGSVLVSAGGGLVGEPLLRAALDAHRLIPRECRLPLSLVAGPFLPDSAWRRLEACAAGQGDVEMLRSVPNLAAEMADAAVSISQCGYNTALDILHAGVRALVVPFGGEDEDEQLKRAERLEALGALRLLRRDALTTERLAVEMQALLAFEPRPAVLALDGAERTARILQHMCASAHGVSMRSRYEGRA
jgi:predicted glycosyltransferase